MDSRVIVVSGGSRGLGAAIARHLLDRGDVVATFSRRPTPFVEEVRADPARAGRFVWAAVDVADRDGVAAFVRGLVVERGGIYGLVNNAGVARDGLLTLQPYKEIDEVIDVNLKGMLYLTRACLKPMLVAGRGRVVNISSIIGLRGYRGLSAYAATKGAMDAVTRSLAREVGSRGITVNSIAPGYLRTEMTHGLDDAQMGQIARRTPAGRLGLPEDVLPAVDFFLSEAAGFVTGQVLVVDGGLTC